MGDGPITRPASDGRLGRWGWVVVAAAGLAAYQNSFAGVYVFDDIAQLGNNPRLREPLGSNLLTWEGPRPFGDWTFVANAALLGPEPWGFHLGNLLIHLAAGAVLWDLVRRTLRLPRLAGRFAGRAGAVATAAAGLWVAHPLTTQAVTYLIQRHESLMGLLYLSTVYAVLRGATATGRAGRWGWSAAAVLFCLLGMWTKQVMATAPVVALAYDRVFVAGSWREVARRRWAVHLGLFATWAALAPAVAPLLVPPTPGAATAPPDPDFEVTRLGQGNDAGFGVEGVTPVVYLCSQAGVILHYLRLAAWPDTLCLDYWWPAATSFRAVAGPGAVVVGLLGLTAWALAVRPPLGFLGVWFFGILSVSSSVVPIRDLAVEHRMYLPLAAVVLLGVLAADAGLAALRARGWPAERCRVIACGAFAVTLAALVGRTVSRNADYRSVITMWEATAAARSENPWAHWNLACFYLGRGDKERAIAEYRHAVRIHPNHKVYQDLGALLVQTGRPGEAVAPYRAAVALKPDRGSIRRKLAGVLEMTGDYRGAEAEAREAIRLDPADTAARMMLGRLLLAEGKADEAVAAFEEVARRTPADVAASEELGTALARVGRYNDAEAALRRAAADPAAERAAGLLGAVELYRSRPAAALVWFREAARRDPNDCLAASGVGQALYESGDRADAAAEFRRCDRMAATWVDALRGQAWGMATDPDPGRRFPAEALRLARLTTEASGDDRPDLLDVLAAAHAANGHFAEAREAARKAITSATKTGQTELAGRIAERLRGYEADRPFRRPGGP